MVIGITGATGFIGKNLVEYLIHRNYKIVIYKRKTSNIEYFRKWNIEFRNIDYYNKDSLNEKFKDIDCLIYLAGLTKSLKKEEFFKVNYYALKNVVEEVNNSNPSLHFIYLSSQSASGPAKNWKIPKKITDEENPISYYGRSKLKGEKYIEKKLKNYTILRLVSVFGPYDFDGLKFFKMALGRYIFNAGKELPKLNVIYVKEVVKNIESIIGNGNFFSKKFHMGYPEMITTEKFVSTIRSVCGIEKRIYYIKIPIFLVEFFAIILDVFQKMTGKISILNREKIKEIKALYWIADCERFYQYQAIKVEYSFEEMVKDTLKFYIENGYIKKRCKNII